MARRGGVAVGDSGLLGGRFSPLAGQPAFQRRELALGLELEIAKPSAGKV